MSTQAIFSMSFFNFTPASQDQPERWTLSEKFWIFWVVALVLTAVTMLTWTIFLLPKARKKREV
jgi:hypothetical protein